MTEEEAKLTIVLIGDQNVSVNNFDLSAITGTKVRKFLTISPKDEPEELILLIGPTFNMADVYPHSHLLKRFGVKDDHAINGGGMIQIAPEVCLLLGQSVDYGRYDKRLMSDAYKNQLHQRMKRPIHFVGR